MRIKILYGFVALILFFFANSTSEVLAVHSQSCFTVPITLTLSPTTAAPGDTITIRATANSTEAPRTLNVLIDPVQTSGSVYSFVEIAFVQQGGRMVGTSAYTIPSSINNGRHEAQIWGEENPADPIYDCHGIAFFDVSGATSIPAECQGYVSGLIGCVPWENTLPQNCRDFFYCKCTGSSIGCVYTAWLNCGRVGQPCCDVICPADNAMCDTTTSPYACVACGDYNQRCCTGPGDVSQCLASDLQLECVQGLCDSRLPKVYCDSNDEASPIPSDRLFTALGCLNYTGTNALAIVFLRVALGILGGIILILLFISAMMVMSSSGDPRRLQAGSELLTSVVTGTIMVLFSVMILHLIGVRILGIF